MSVGRTPYLGYWLHGWLVACPKIVLFFQPSRMPKTSTHPLQFLLYSARIMVRHILSTLKLVSQMVGISANSLAEIGLSGDPTSSVLSPDSEGMERRECLMAG